MNTYCPLILQISSVTWGSLPRFFIFKMSLRVILQCPIMCYHWFAYLPFPPDRKLLIIVCTDRFACACVWFNYVPSLSFEMRGIVNAKWYWWMCQSWALSAGDKEGRCTEAKDCYLPGTHPVGIHSMYLPDEVKLLYFILRLPCKYFTSYLYPENTSYLSMNLPLFLARTRQTCWLKSIFKNHSDLQNCTSALSMMRKSPWKSMWKIKYLWSSTS